MSGAIFLTLEKVFSYLNAQVQSRCIIEGQEILNTKHIILLAKLLIPYILLRYWRYVFRQVGLKVILIRSMAVSKCCEIFEIGVHIISAFQCSYKADMSGTCKQIAAVLYFLKLKSFLNILVDLMKILQKNC